MKKLYLHLGFQKTATTSFQSTCIKNINHLLKQGITYPLLSKDTSDLKILNNHQIFFRSLYHNNPKTYFFHILNKKININLFHQHCLSTLATCFNSGNTVIISGEDIPIIEEEKLLNLKEYFLSFHFDIIPIAIVRSPYEFACSLWQQKIKRSDIPSSFPNSLRLHEKIKKIFPQTQFYPFRETYKHKDGPIGFLLEKMGVDYTDFEFINSNESMSNIITRVQEELNKYEKRIKDQKKNPYFISIKKYDSKAFGGKYSNLTFC